MAALRGAPSCVSPCVCPRLIKTFLNPAQTAAPARATEGPRPMVNTKLIAGHGRSDTRFFWVRRGEQQYWMASVGLVSGSVSYSGRVETEQLLLNALTNHDIVRSFESVLMAKCILCA